MNRKGRKIEDILIRANVCQEMSAYLVKDDYCFEDNDESLVNQTFILTIFKSDDEYNPVDKIGEIMLTYLDLDMGFEPFEVFDIANGEIANLYPHIYNCDDDYFEKFGVDELKDEFDSFSYNDFIYINSIYIDEKYQNLGIGSSIISHIREIIFNLLKLKVKCIFLYAKPQYQDENGEIENNPDKDAQEKLIKFYKKCGFTRIRNTGYMYINNDYTNG